jgi:hypothetical protein
MPSTTKWTATNKQDLIIEVWEALDCESVGCHELEKIQEALNQRFGPGGQESPAAIARVVADEGAVLRHPEVLECDSKWRLKYLHAQAFETELDFSDFEKAVASFATIERQASGDGRLREVVTNARQNQILISRSKIIDPANRERAKEISHWLLVWLQSPQLFSDWLELRLRSDEFRKKFPNSC